MVHRILNTNQLHQAARSADRRWNRRHRIAERDTGAVLEPGGNITGDIAVFQHCPELRLINCRESKKVMGDIMHLQNCSNLTSFAMLRTRVAGNARVVREHLHNLVKFDCQSTQITGKTSDFRFCTNL